MIERRELRDSLMKGLQKFATRKVDEAIAQKLLDCVTCIEADPKDPSFVRRMSERLDKLEAARQTGGNRLFYLATPPDAFAPIAKAARPRRAARRKNGAWRRLVVEKPFGTDLDSAKTLNAELLGIVEEQQIYRIDHYLGKETVQNILVLRFANGMFEPIWNRNHIDHVQITVDEKLGVGHRGSFYDATGALRDMVPNHLFQLLSLVAMEPPARFDAHSVRVGKGRRAGRDPDRRARQRRCRIRCAGNTAPARSATPRSTDYRKTADVSARQHHGNLRGAEADHRQLALGRRAVLPAHRQGARRQAHRGRDQVQAGAVRDVPLHAGGALSQNYLVIGIEPTEGIALQFNTKVPGPAIEIDGVEMKFRYKDYFKAAPRTGYETLIYDCMIGDNILFQRADSVEAGWAAVQPFLDAWQNAGAKGLQPTRPAAMARKRPTNCSSATAAAGGSRLGWSATIAR